MSVIVLPSGTGKYAPAFTVVPLNPKAASFPTPLILNTVNTVSVLATIVYPYSEVCAPVPVSILKPPVPETFLN